MKKYIIAIAVLACAAAVFAAGRCAVCKGSGWDGSFKCKTCGGDGDY